MNSSEPPTSTPVPEPDEPTRSELAIQAQAARHEWPISPDRRRQIVETVTELVAKTSKPRTAIAAARTLIAFERLNLEQRKLEAAQAVEPPPPPPREPTDGDGRDQLLKDEIRTRWRTTLASRSASD